jgi:PAS domain S-box-containing protein
LRESEGRFRAVIENTKDVIFQLSTLGVIQFISPRVEESYGYRPEELIGKHLKKTTPMHEVPKALETLKRILSGEEIRNFEISQLDKKGKRIRMEINATPIKKDNKIIGVQGIMRDITERKKAEEELRKAYESLKESQLQLIQSEKLAAIGQLATGVAHEINNPLFAISGEAEMLLKDEKIDKEVRDAAKIIIEQSERIKGVVENILDFSRKKRTEEKFLDIRDALEKSLTLLQYRSKIENIKIVKELDPALPRIIGDKNQLQEAFLCIMMNAAQSMKKGGSLTIRAYREKIKRYGRRYTDKFKLGTEIAVIEFRDTGKGIDAESLRRIFEPFFSMREKGTGLGLSICQKTINNHGGVIEAESEVGKGSTFVVRLPIPKKGGK